MKQILFPTDFSPASKEAFKYTIELALAMDAEIKVIHCYAPAIDPSQPIVLAPLEENRKMVNERLKHFIQIYPNEMPDGKNLLVNIKPEELMGFPVEEIVRQTLENDVDLVAMSTRGKHGALDHFFGTISAAVSRNAHSPVLLIPEGVSFKPFKHILYATNVESLQDPLIDQVIGIAKIYGSTIHFVHVENEPSNLLNEAIPHLIDRFQESAPEISFEFNGIKEDEVISGIEKYLEDHPIDLVSYGTKHRSFWENIMHKGQTRKMALNTKLPMLVVHLGD